MRRRNGAVGEMMPIFLVSKIALYLYFFFGVKQTIDPSCPVRAFTLEDNSFDVDIFALYSSTAYTSYLGN